MARLLEIPLEDDERRRFGTATAVTLAGTLRRFVLDVDSLVAEVGRFGFVAASELSLDLSTSLAACFFTGLFDPSALGVTHTERDEREWDNAVVETGSCSGRHCVHRRE